MRKPTIVLVLFYLLFANFAQAHVGTTLNDTFYSKVSSSEHLRSHYAEGDLRILIVPGHAQFESGTSYAGVYERDLNVAVASNLMKYLGQDNNLRIYLARDSSGAYARWFQAYLNSGLSEIKKYREEIIKVYNSLPKNSIAPVSTIKHNTASENASLELYALNKFANDNRIDIALHLHINDYPRPNTNSPGKHIGFTIYVPSPNLGNHEASNTLANTLRDTLAKIIPLSTLPGEDTGVTVDKELIAIGSNGSRDNASLLIEYGYIYEPQFMYPNLSAIYLDELAYQTASGLLNFFAATGTSKVATKSKHTLVKPLVYRTRNSADVLAMQLELSKRGFYPPQGSTLRDCPITGNFGPCTREAVRALQARNGLEQVGNVGQKTLMILNSDL